MGNLWGMSSWFGALVWAPRALDGDKFAWCGYLWLHDITFTIWNHDKKGSFWRVFLTVLGLFWGPQGPWRGKIPLPDVDEILWWSNMWLVLVFVVAWHHFHYLKSWWKWVFLKGISGCFGVVVGAQRALHGENTPSRCGWYIMMK